MKPPAPTSLAFDVRDYECDLQGIVNNAVYLHYLEHARHQYLKQRGFDFEALNRAGIRLVVVRAEVDYRAPLKSGDRFIVESRLERMSPVRMKFLQDIIRLPERKLIVAASFACAAVDPAGRPMIPTALEPLFEA